MLVWLDLETTGLEPSKEHVIEAACIITDDALTEVARFERVIYSPKADLILRAVDGMTAEQFRALPSRRQTGEARPSPNQEDIVAHTGVDPFVVAMHLENGLWEKCRRGENIATVDADLREFILKHGVETVTKTYPADGDKPETTKTFVNKPQLAGSTISFDREFLRAHFPRTTDEKTGALHYRNIDVSTLNELARRFWKPLHEARPGRDARASHRGMDDIQASIEVLRHYLRGLFPFDWSKVQWDPATVAPVLPGIPDQIDWYRITCDAAAETLK